MGMAMEISLGILLILCLFFFLAGFVDSIAGGGGLISTPAMLVCGLPPHVALGTGKLFKHHKVPVYYSVIRGGYLTSPKYNLRDRVGHVEVEYVSGNREKFNFTCIPAGTTLDDEHTITNDDFPMGILAAVKLVMPILNEEK